MKTMMLTAKRRMKLREVPTPRVRAAHDVLIKVNAVGVCGSDVHYYLDGRIGCQVVEYPFTVGHEFSGTVQEVGKAVKHLKPGARVAIDPAMTCGKCDQCRAGRPHTCRKNRFLGCPGQAEGCLSEYIVMPDECCIPIRPGTTFEQAAIVEPLSIGTYAVGLSVPMKGARIAILGCGPIGLSCLLPAKAQGAAAVYMTDLRDYRLKIARQAGATWTGNPDREDIVAAISKREPLLLDAVLECCGEQSAIDQAVKLLKPGGRLVLVGIPTVDRISFAIDEMRRKEIVLQNIRRQNGCALKALKSIESGKVDVDFMVTHRFPLEKTHEAFELVANYRDGVVKAMIVMA
jgi:L-iditol 2-dehydrogenase